MLSAKYLVAGHVCQMLWQMLLQMLLIFFYLFVRVNVWHSKTNPVLATTQVFLRRFFSVQSLQDHDRTVEPREVCVWERECVSVHAHADLLTSLHA